MTDVRTRPNTDELRAEIERALCERFRRPSRVVTIARRSSAYHTTSPIEELTVELDDGECLHLILKDLSRRALSPPCSATSDSRKFALPHRPWSGNEGGNES